MTETFGNPDDFALVALAREQGWLSEAQVDACLSLDRGWREFLRDRAGLTSDQIAELERRRDDQMQEEMDRLSGMIPKDRIIAGRYRLTRVLGDGASSRVYQAKDEQLNRWVAIKFLSTNVPAARERFRREAQIVAKLQHPNIAQVYDVLEGPILVMQLIEGSTLTGRGKSVDDCVRLAVEVCRAVEYAHSRGVIHRDLKPENVMVDAQGRVYVLDFGLARDEEISAQRLSVTGAVMGTPAFMSPEQAQGKLSQIGERSDVYSLGAILFELLTQRPPFQGDSAYQVVQKVIDEDPPSPRRLNSGVDYDLNTVVLRAMAKEPERRYPSAAELREDLERYLRREPVKARVPSLRYRIGRQWKRHRAVTIAGLALLLVSLAAGIAVSVQSMMRSAQKEALLKLAVDYERSEAWSESLAVYQKVLALDPGDASIEAHCDSLRRRMQTELNSLKARVELFLPLENDLKILRLLTYRKGYRLDEEQLQQYEDLDARVAAKVKETGESSQACYLRGRIRHALGDRVLAEAHYQRGLQLDPEHPGCLLYQARLVMEEALFEHFLNSRGPMADERRESARVRALKAVELLKRAKGPDVPALERDLLEGYALIVQWRPAAEFCTRMLNKWQNQIFSEEFYLIRGLAQSTDAYIAGVSQAIEARPGFAEAYFWRGIARRTKGDLEGAMADFDQAIELNPRLVEAYNNRAAHRLEVGDLTGAIADCDRAITLHPEFAEAYLNRGYARLISGDADRAIEDYTKALEIQPQFVEALSNRAQARRLKKDLAGAVADGEAAVKLNPRYAEAYINLGSALFDRGDVQEALQAYNKALQCNSRLWQAYWNRATARLQLAAHDAPQRSLAIDDLEAALRYATPDWKERGQAQALLKDLRRQLEY